MSPWWGALYMRLRAQVLSCLRAKYGYTQNVGLANPIVINYCNETDSEVYSLKAVDGDACTRTTSSEVIVVGFSSWVRFRHTFYVMGRHLSKTDYYELCCNKWGYIAQCRCFSWCHMTCLAWHIILGFELFNYPLDVLSFRSWCAINLPPRKNHTSESLCGHPCVDLECSNLCHVEELVCVSADATYKWTTTYESYHRMRRFSSDRDVPALLGVEDEWKAKQISHPRGRGLPLINVLIELSDRCPFCRGDPVCHIWYERLVMRHLTGGCGLSVIELECSIPRSPFDRSQFVKGLIVCPVSFYGLILHPPRQNKPLVGKGSLDRLLRDLRCPLGKNLIVKFFIEEGKQR